MNSRGKSIFLPFIALESACNPWLSAIFEAIRVKCLPAMRETQVRSLGWKDPREKEMATQFSILAQGIMDREAWWATYSPRGRKESDMAEQLTRHHDLSQKKNPLQN